MLSGFISAVGNLFKQGIENSKDQESAGILEEPNVVYHKDQEHMEIKQPEQVESAPVFTDAELIADNQVDTSSEEPQRKLIKTFREPVLQY